ncbi:hypothetical protein BM1_09197 [Bipolaris maydis]|nr:hypothetical protein BM1_09197 [Bipolaris maydis]KAJ5024387.1 hypothetical protein J3E73DRAFT_372324 [Bipolaris maydis]
MKGHSQCYGPLPYHGSGNVNKDAYTKHAAQHVKECSWVAHGWGVRDEPPIYHLFALYSFRHSYNKGNDPNWRDSVASSARHGANKDSDTKSLGIARPLEEHLQAS